MPAIVFKMNDILENWKFKYLPGENFASLLI